MEEQKTSDAAPVPVKSSVNTFVGRRWQNWSRNHSTHIHLLLTPHTEADIIDCIQHARRSHATIKVLGAGHSLSLIAVPDASNGWPMSLHRYNRILSVDHSRRLVTAQAGCTLKALNAHLHSVGLALHLLGSISEQTLGGVVQTGTHATGARYGPFHTQLHSFVLITGRGERLHLSADDPQQSELFNAMVVGLGVMGVVSEVTLRVVPLFKLHEVTYGLTWDEMLTQLPQLVHSNDRLKLLYFPYTEHVGVWTANPVDDESTDTPAPLTTAAAEPVLPVRPPTPEPNDPFMHSATNLNTDSSQQPPSAATPPTSVDVAAIRRDNESEYRKAYGRRKSRVEIAQQILNCECGEAGSEYATEGCFPFTATNQVLIHWRHLIDSRRLPARGNIEIRFVRGDSAWMSTTYVPSKQCETDESAGDESLFLFIAVNWVLQAGEGCEGSEGEGYLDVFRTELVGRFNGRMHWGKMGEQPGNDVRQRYERWEEFRRLRAENDPDGVWLNAFTREALLLSETGAVDGVDGQ